MDSSEGHNLRSDRWIAINLLLECPDALFYGVDEESILGDDEVLSTRLDGRFARAITFDPTVGSRSIFLLEFPDALFHGVDEESILGDDEVC